ncbi:MAG: galactose-1-phosphate uridylyltransferase [Pyrinomonadaceae bacterium]
MSELRFNPVLGEWTATATARQDRTFLPPADYCPLCPTLPGGFPTEIPAADYDIVAFENKFPSLKTHPPEPAIEGDDFYRVRPSVGVCEVVVYSPRHSATLTTEPIEQIYKLILVWTERFRELGSLDFVNYVFIFENKGEAVGVTLHHPHGQIYAYPFIPPVILKELKQCRKHSDSTGRCLFCDVIAKEQAFEQRIIAENDSFLAVIPFFARYPYETHIFAKSHKQALTDFERGEQFHLAEILKQVLVAFDGIFERSFPYIMSIHQRPSDGGNYENYHFHIEFYPPMRTREKLKYLAGSEAGAGMFINDTLPEEKAAQLRALVQPVSWSS